MTVSELLIMLSLTMALFRISDNSCVTTMASPQNFLTVLYRYRMYPAIMGDVIAFQASSMISALRRSCLCSIFWINTSITDRVTMASRVLFSFIESISMTKIGREWRGERVCQTD